MVEIAQYDYRDALLLMRAMQEYLFGPRTTAEHASASPAPDFRHARAGLAHELIVVEDTKDLLIRKQVRLQKYLRPWARQATVMAASLACIADVMVSHNQSQCWRCVTERS